ncbi:MAG: chemotaxis protein CheX [Planctomycetota bacterium]|nr:MAG: chemotaxis protein CheX [Planctomycetota bacterium]
MPPLDVTTVNPFVESLSTVFTTMLSLKPTRLRARAACATDRRALTSLIGISGRFSGVVALRFPPETAKNLAERLLSTEVPDDSEEIADAIAELANMVAGAAKAKFNSDPPLALGLPTVVDGAGYRMHMTQQTHWLEVPYESEAGSFSLELAFGVNEEQP